MAEKKLILFGGSFDPIHLGHTAVAQSAFEQIGGDELVFIPAKQSPLKFNRPHACDDDRMEMIKLAIAGIAGFSCSDFELNKSPGPSYTIETVRHFREAAKEPIKIFWLVGADATAELCQWYKIGELLELCDICIMYRGGMAAPHIEDASGAISESQLERLRANIIKTPLVESSSTEIRRRLSSGQDVTGLLHPAVEKYIREKGLYGTTTSTV